VLLLQHWENQSNQFFPFSECAARTGEGVVYTKEKFQERMLESEDIMLKGEYVKSKEKYTVPVVYFLKLKKVRCCYVGGLTSCWRKNTVGGYCYLS